MAVIDLPELGIATGVSYGDDDDETRRRREAERAALDMLANPDRGADTGLSRQARPGALPSYAESAAAHAPEEVAPRMVRRPEHAPLPATVASAPAVPASPRGGDPPRAAKPEPGRSPSVAVGARGMGEADPDLAAAERTRDSRRTRNSVVDTIGFLLAGMTGAPMGAVSQQIGQPGNANQPVEDLMARRREQERQLALRAQREGAQREQELDAALRDPSSEQSRSAQALMRAVAPGIDDETLSRLSAADFQRAGLGAFVQSHQRAVQAQQLEGQRQEGRVDLQDDRQGWQDDNREDSQAHQLERDERQNAARLQLAELTRRRRSGGGGGAGGQQELRAIVQAGLQAGGLDEQSASVLATRMNARSLQQNANIFSGAMLRGAAEGGERAQNRMIERSSRYMRETQELVEMEQRVGAVQRLLQGASDNQIREAIGAMNAGETAVAALMEADPRAGQLAMATSGLQNVILRIQSGAAVSNQEFARLRSAFGSGSVLSGAALRYGVQSLAQAQAAIRQHFDHGYQDVIEWEAAGRPAPRRNIDLSGGGNAPTQPAAAGDQVRVRYQGRVLNVPRANLQRALDDGAEVLDAP